MFGMVTTMIQRSCLAKQPHFPVLPPCRACLVCQQGWKKHSWDNDKISYQQSCKYLAIPKNFKKSLESLLR